MKRLFFMLVLCCMVLCVSACQANVQADIASAGRIGDEQPVSRAMAAKTIALAFYSMEELKALEQSADFPDVSKTDWAYPYINGAVALGYLSGDEDGNFYPEQDLTLLQTQCQCLIACGYNFWKLFYWKADKHSGRIMAFRSKIVCCCKQRMVCLIVVHMVQMV